MSKIEEFNEKREGRIVSLEDSRLVLIRPKDKNFFKKVLQEEAFFKNDDERYRWKKFLELVKKAQEADLAPFRVPIYDPSLDGEEVRFEEGKNAAVDYSYNFWLKKIGEMPAVGRKHWAIGSIYLYGAFCVWLINKFSRISNFSMAVNEVVFTSNRVYGDGESFFRCIKKTGCPLYPYGDIYARGNKVRDLRNRWKFLAPSVDDDHHEFYLAAVQYCNYADWSDAPLAYVDAKPPFWTADTEFCQTVPWIVLK